ncbi:DinB family protein [Streptomyces sp. NBC_01456]|uniref:DinB family protein n=1 Tax=unclassified Streptomyces TaxID=2593676 RepID=UPI002E2FB91A|nr:MULTISPECIES: DinB family protein [unclassified Streptomyces]
MTGQDAPRHFAPGWKGDSRGPVPAVGGERETLGAVLDWHRDTFALKCAGLPPALLSRRAIPPSALSLHGLVRHLAGVERWWFRIQFAGEDLPLLHYSDEDPDQDFGVLDGDADAAFAVWRAECAHSRRITAQARSLEETGIRKRTGEPLSLRRILIDMIAEYARHNGHADLLRERLDGATGV